MAALVLAVLAPCLLGLPVAAAHERGAAEDLPRRQLAAGSVVQLRTVQPDGVITFGSGRRVVGDVTIRATDDGLAVVNALPIEDYVRGVAEMPATWPAEALQAQAIAARTYAWYQLETGVFDARGYDICATVACQVYDGVRRVEGLLTASWAEAVAATEGQVLVDDDGAPILARYFSTSGGRTRDNAVVFGGDLPYLRGVDDPDDAIAPLHEWQVTFTRDELDAVLAEGETLAEAVPLVDIEAVDGSDGLPRAVLVTGMDGTAVEVGAATFRTFVSEQAPRLFPDRFPSARADGRTLPSAMPSTRVTFTVTSDEVVVDGAGWGHGVGMGQWGARGRAERGQSAEEILAAYYGGLEPTTADALPATMRVGLGTSASPVEVRADLALEVVVDGVVEAGTGYGPFLVTRTDAGLRVDAPPGWGDPLRLEVPQVPERLSPTRDLEVRLDAGRPARIDLEVVAGDEVVDSGLVVTPAAGPVLTVLRAPEDDWPEGDLELRAVADDGRGNRMEQTTTLVVGEDDADARGTIAGGDAGRGPDFTGPMLLLGILGTLGAGLWLMVSRGEAASGDRHPGGKQPDGRLR